MARIRSIHPGLMTDESFMALTVECSLAVPLYLGILMESDDEGIFEWKPLTLKARILPAVTVDLGPILEALVRHRFVMRYEMAGRQFGAVRNFTKYQSPKKPRAVHPKTDAVRLWVGIVGSSSTRDGGIGDRSPDPGSPPVPNQSETGEEKSRQRDREREKDREKDLEIKSAAAEPEDAAAALRDECSKLCGAEPCVASTDFHQLEALIGRDGITRSDVVEGVRVGLAKAEAGYRFRNWRNFAGWVRGAAKDRMASGPRQTSVKAPDDPNDPRIDFGNGCSAPESSIRTVLALGKCPDDWGPKPGLPGCKIPERLWPERLRNLEVA